MAPKTAYNNEDQPHTPIAICGISTRLPGGIRNADQLWGSIAKDCGSYGPVRLDGNEDRHDLKKGLRSFDASLFSMTDEEAKSYSPQQHKLLEVTRECFEDACEINYRGEDACVGCYIGTSNEDDASVVSSKNDLKGPRFVSKSVEVWQKFLRSCVARLLTCYLY